MYKIVTVFRNSRVNEVMSTARIIKYSKRDLFEVTLDLHGLWGSDSCQSMDIYLWVGCWQRRFSKMSRLNLIMSSVLSIDILLYFR